MAAGGLAIDCRQFDANGLGGEDGSDGPIGFTAFLEEGDGIQRDGLVTTGQKKVIERAETGEALVISSSLDRGRRVEVDPFSWTGRRIR